MSIESSPDLRATEQFFAQINGVIEAELFFRGKALVAYITVELDCVHEPFELRHMCLEALGHKATPDLVLVTQAMPAESRKAA